MWTLVIWTVVAYGGGGQFATPYYDWRPIASNLASKQACDKAAEKLDRKQYINKPMIYHCIGPEG